MTQPAAANENGPDVGDWQFYTGLICMADGDPTANVTEAAQQWNLKFQAVNDGSVTFGITAKNNCVTAGYPPSRRFTIDTAYLPSDSACVRFYNQERDQYGRWTNNPYAIVNTACGYTTHYISGAIGQIIGARWMNSSGYNSRVMNNTAFSVQNVPYATENDGGVIWLQYITPYGSN